LPRHKAELPPLMEQWLPAGPSIDHASATCSATTPQSVRIVAVAERP